MVCAKFTCFSLANEVMKIGKRKEIFANYISGRSLMLRMYEELLKPKQLKPIQHHPILSMRKLSEYISIKE